MPVSSNPNPYPNPYPAYPFLNPRGNRDDRGMYHTRPSSPYGGRLRYYPLLRGLQDTNVQRSNVASAQRAPLSGPQPYERQLGMNNEERAFSQPQAAHPRQGQPQRPPQPADPAAHLRQINQTLPDGVHYEPLDESTLRMLRASGKLPAATPASSVAQAGPARAPSAHPGAYPSYPSAQPSDSAAASDYASAPSGSAATPGYPAAQSGPASAPPYGSAASAYPSTPYAPAPQASPYASPYASSGTQSGVDPRAEALQNLIQDERNGAIFYSHLADRSPRADFKTALLGVADDCKQRVEIYKGLLQQLFRRQFEPEEAVINTRVNFREGIALAVQEENNSLRALSELLEKMDSSSAAKALQNIINKKIVGHNLLNFMNADMAR